MKQGVKLAGRVWLYYLIMTLVSFFFVLSVSGLALRIVFGCVLIVGFSLLALNEGGYRGEKACTLAATIEKQLKDGRKVDDEDRASVWSKRTAVAALIVAVLPFWLVAGVNLAVEPLYPASETPAVETPAAESNPIITDSSQRAEPETSGEDLNVNWVAFASRVVFAPYLAILYELVSTRVMYLLFFPCALIMPCAACAGYMMGPKLRKKKLADIEKGKRRKMRNLKVFAKPRAPKPPKAEV